MYRFGWKRLDLAGYIVVGKIQGLESQNSTFALQATVITGQDLSGIKELTPDPSGPSGNYGLFITPQTPLFHISVPTPIRAARIRLDQGAHQITASTPM